jgi:hypothetical protein
MERGDSLRGSRASEEVDDLLEAQRRRTNDRALTGSGHVLNIGDLSASVLFRIAAMGWAGLLELLVKEAEERVLAGAVAKDVEERADALIKQLEDVDRHGVCTFSILSLVSSFFCAFI